METVSSLVTSSIPKYLSGLPVPNSFKGWFSLSIRDWISLIPPTAFLAGIGYTCYRAYCPAALKRCKTNRVNGKIRMGEEKVVDMIDIENIGNMAAFCRCWNSKNWPYCDGSHVEHNKTNGDNVGPVVLKRKGA